MIPIGNALLKRYFLIRQQWRSFFSPSSGKAAPLSCLRAMIDDRAAIAEEVAIMAISSRSIASIFPALKRLDPYSSYWYHPFFF